MSLFNRKKIEKESHIATTPEESKMQINSNKKNIAFLIWNILSIALYSSYTLFVIYKLCEHNFLSKIIVYLLGAYAVAFVLLILISIGNRTKLIYRLKNLQSVANFFKYFIQIANFVLSIITAISAFITNGTTDFSSILYAILSLAITLIFIIVEIAKIIIRKNLPLIKYNILKIHDKLPKSANQQNKVIKNPIKNNNQNNDKPSLKSNENQLNKNENDSNNDESDNINNQSNTPENDDEHDPYDDILNI